MTTGGDTIDRAFELILADDRRRLTEEEERAAKRLWRNVFAQVAEAALLKAVLLWLQEKPRGRPHVAEIKGILTRDAHRESAPVQRYLPFSDQELSWAISIARDPHPWTGNYAHTLDLARHIFARCGLQVWQDAKRHLEPGWAPSTTTEVYL